MTLNPKQFKQTQLPLDVPETTPHPGDMSPSQWMARPDVRFHGSTGESRFANSNNEGASVVGGLPVNSGHFRHFGTESSARDILRSAGFDTEYPAPFNSAIHAMRIPGLVDDQGGVRNVASFPEGFPSHLSPLILRARAHESDSVANMADMLASEYHRIGQDYGDHQSYHDEMRSAPDGSDELPTTTYSESFRNDPHESGDPDPDNEFPHLSTVTSHAFDFPDPEAVYNDGVDPATTGDIKVGSDADAYGDQPLRPIVRSARQLLRGEPVSYLNPIEGTTDFTPKGTSVVVRSDVPRSYTQDIADSPNRPEPIREWARSINEKHSDIYNDFGEGSVVHWPDSDTRIRRMGTGQSWQYNRQLNLPFSNPEHRPEAPVYPHGPLG